MFVGGDKSTTVHATLRGLRKKHVKPMPRFIDDSQDTSGRLTASEATPLSVDRPAGRSSPFRRGSRIRLLNEDEQRTINELADELDALMREADEWQRKIDGQVAENQALMETILQKSMSTKRSRGKKLGETQFSFPLSMLGPSAPALGQLKRPGAGGDLSLSSPKTQPTSARKSVRPRRSDSAKGKNPTESERSPSSGNNKASQSRRRSLKMAADQPKQTADQHDDNDNDNDDVSTAESAPAEQQSTSPVSSEQQSVSSAASEQQLVRSAASEQQLTSAPVEQAASEQVEAVSPSVARSQDEEAAVVAAVQWDAGKLKLREHVAKEILQTEKNYGQTLTTLVDQYLIPLRKLADTPKQVCSKEDLRTVFYQLEVLRGINSLIESQLEARVSSWHDGQTLGDVFLIFSQALKAYSTYINNYAQALSRLGELQQSAPFAKFCRRRKGEWLDSMLIQPVQRIPQYILLLSSLLDATPAGHPDLVLVTKGLQAVKQTAAQNHRAQRILENALVLQGLERKLSMRLSEGHRHFVRSFDVCMWDVKKKRVGRHTIFLFSDMLLITKKLPGEEPPPPTPVSASTSGSLLSAAAAASSSSSASDHDRYKVLERLSLIDILRIVRERSIIREILPDSYSISLAFAEAMKKQLAAGDDEPLWEAALKKLFILATLFRPFIMCSGEKDEVVSAINTHAAEATDNVRSRDSARF